VPHCAPSGKKFLVLIVIALFVSIASAQAGHDVAPPPPPGVKTNVCSGRPVPQLEDITVKAGIDFHHTYSAEKKYIP
jgi:hypothetical protein